MDFDTLHRKRVKQYGRTLEQIYNGLIARVSSLVVKSDITNKIYRFRNNKKILLEIEKALDSYYKNTLNTINIGTEKQWQFANEKYNALRIATLERLAHKLSKETYIREIEKVSKTPHNLKALHSFQQRKINNFTLSERVWSITQQVKSELEMAIDVSLSEGISANELARKIKKNLNEPDRLYRRIRDKHGNLVLSQNAKYYNPGQGVYRSAHKNALRLAKEEINTAYRTSEQIRIMQNNDVVGVEIHLSPSHKVYDICDELAGRYPKNFIWNKWHIGCMCHRRTILKSDEELIKELNNNQELPPETSKYYIGAMPKQFNRWVKDNKDRFKNWKYKPEFLEQNKEFINLKST
ncbi:head morphogenesis capsid protein [Riemerella phage vB_RanS_CRP6]|nr:head morphogenesis capsid protein [Riemerella phage vB_RanS_CRP6]